MRYLNRYRILLQRNIERLPNVAKIIATSVTVLLLLFLYPNNTKFKYEFREGQPWIYENLVSPFDFAIKKSDTEIDAEKLKLTQNIQPFFVKNDSLNEVILKHYQQYFYSVLKNENVAVNKDASLIFQNGKSMLQRALDQGIVESNFINFEKNDYINIYDAGDTYKEKYGKLLHKHTFLEDVKKDNNGSENDNQFLYNVFEHAIQPNILYSDSLTTAYKKSILEKIAIYNGLIIKGEVIVSKGELVTPATVQRLNSYKEQYESESNAHKANKWVYVGYFVLTALLLTIFSLYIYYKQPAIWRNTNQYILLLVILLIMCYLTYAIETSRQISIYLLPFCIVPIIVKQLFTVTLALFMHVIIILTASLITQSSFDFIFMQLATGVVASIALYNSRFWSGFLLTIIFIFLTYIAAYFGLSLIKNTGINFIDWSFISWILINVTLTLLASPLIPIMERLIGKISSVVLMELSDINSPLLKELSIKAPGTFQHSLQVAHLAEAAASEIGANARLVRVGALYHDIGKIKKPKFFIENQRRSDNPHDTISYTESAEIIKAHVADGILLAKKNRIPSVIIDFIRTHHGTTRIEYFYRNYQIVHPNEDVPESFFRYNGPLPSTKEQCVLMFADSLEAISRTLKYPNEAEIDSLVDVTIDLKIKDKQMELSQLNFTELEKIKAVFKKTLKSIHHLRIVYPT